MAGGTQIKRGGWTLSRFKGVGGRGLAKRGGVFSQILKDRVHAIALPNLKTPKQKTIQAMTA